MLIANHVCELLPHIFTITLKQKLTLCFRATLFSVALSVTKTFLFSHPSFQMAGCPMLPGLSSAKLIAAIEKLAVKYTPIFRKGLQNLTNKRLLFDEFILYCDDGINCVE